MDFSTFYKLSYGVYVVSTSFNNKLNGQIANSVVQVTAEPPKIAICINKSNLTYELLKKSKKFSISVMSQNTPMKLIGNFGFKSGRDIEKFEGVDFKIGKNGSPILLENATGYFEGKILDTIDVGTHVTFIGEITDAQNIDKDEPMTYAFYHEVKKGKSPKTAPTYININKQDEKKENKKMVKYVCTVCGYVYDPEIGDPDSGIEPGTSFNDIPEDWVCPVCGVGKDDFEIEE